MGHKEKLKAAHDKHNKEVDDIVSAAIAEASSPEDKARLLGEALLDSIDSSVDRVKKVIQSLIDRK